MNLNDQFLRYFGSADLHSLTPEAIDSGTEHLLVDFGLERDPERRFAMWALLHILGAAPDLDVAFNTEAEREAARNFMDLMASASPSE